MLTKNKKTPAKKAVEKTVSPEREKLVSAAKKLIEKVKASGLKQDFIADKIGVTPQTFSRFMHEQEIYITKSLVSRLTEYFEK
jgi:plasmid maintenance system antidote protein VapI